MDILSCGTIWRHSSMSLRTQESNKKINEIHCVKAESTPPVSRLQRVPV